MSILGQILETKKREVASLQKEHSLSDLESLARSAEAPRSLANALRRVAHEPIRVIAEFKRASPSAGPIAPALEPEEVVRDYEAGGASAVSVLTDEQYFDGSIEFIARARESCRLPILRKDFLIDPVQVAHARAEGADAVLLIVAALSTGQLQELFSYASALGMDALIEVHSEVEAHLALSVGARVIGVNHRDLKTFDVDLSLSERLGGMVTGDTILVAESGIRTPEDVARVSAAGAHAILIGETLMRAKNKATAVRALREEPG